MSAPKLGALGVPAVLAPQRPLALPAERNLRSEGSSYCPVWHGYPPDKQEQATITVLEQVTGPPSRVHRL